MANPGEIVATAPYEIVARQREIIIVSPYEGITRQLKRVIEACRPDVKVGVISELNGVMHVSDGDINFGKDYPSLRGVDFGGRNWNYDQEPWGIYVEKQLHEVREAMVREMMAGHDPALVIDLEQLAGNWGDVTGVYNIGGFEDWCLENRVPRITLPDEVKHTLMERTKWDPYQGCHTHTPYLDGNELERAGQDLMAILTGDTKKRLLFQYQLPE